MNSLVTIQNVGVIIWDGTASIPRDIRRFVRFGFSFEVIAALAADTVFNIRYHNPDPANDCLPGAAVPVPEISICDSPAVPGPQATVTIPAGTPIGTVCAGTLPCRPGAFISLAGVSGDVADIRAVLVRQGPMI